jgi:hypothetical protein
MRKITASVLALLLLMLGAAPVFAAPTVILDGEVLEFDVPPAIAYGRTLVPLRAIFEALGATVYWDETTQTVVAEKESVGRVVSITIGKQEAYVNNAAIKLDVPAVIFRGRTLVPLRFVSEALGATVEWSAETQTITITSAQDTIAIYLDGELLGHYSGQFKDGLANGRGTFTNLEGVIYSGDFKDGINIAFWEKGSMQWPDGTLYTGAMQQCFPHGEGIKIFADGRQYKGSFVEGKMEGQGYMLLADRRTYVGSFTNDEVTGVGTITWPDDAGIVYQGEVNNGIIEGRGKLTADGNVYTGEFKNNWADGKGIMVFADGSKYTGYFQEGFMHGYGVLTLSNGTVIKGQWVKGVYQN